MARDALSTGVGVGLIVVGILLLIGTFSLQQLLPFAGVVLIVLGVLILTKVFPAGTLVGVAVLVVGILMVEDVVPMPRAFRTATSAVFHLINIVAGVVMIALGIAKLNEGR